MLHVLSLSAAFGVIAFASAQSAPDQGSTVPTGFLDKTIRVGEREYRYVLYVPPDFRPGVRWPLVMFLNGMGECGTDGKRQVAVGLGPAIRSNALRWPFFVVFPQKPDKESQWIEHDALVMATLAATEKEFPIDTRQRFLTGLSQGGAGTWAIGAKHADVWGAIAPVCGYGKGDEVAARLVDMPIWAFHGVDDQAVPVQQSKDLCAAVERAGGHARLTLYEKTAHNSWDKAYRESALAEWLGTVVLVPALAAAFAEPDLVSGRFRFSWYREVAAPDERLRAQRARSASGDTWSLEITSEGATCTFEAAGAEPAEPRRVAVPVAEARNLLMRHLQAVRLVRLLQSPKSENSAWRETIDPREVLGKDDEARSRDVESRSFQSYHVAIALECRGLRCAFEDGRTVTAKDGWSAMQVETLTSVQASLARLFERR